MLPGDITNGLDKLTPELWAKVLFHLLPDQANDFERTDVYKCIHQYSKHQKFLFGTDNFAVDGDSQENPCIHGFVKYQAFLRGIPLVCKLFAAIFQDSSCFSQSLTLGKTVGSTAPGRDSLLDWVQRHGKHVQVLSVNHTGYRNTAEVFESTVHQLALAPSSVFAVLLENCHRVSELALLTSIQTLALEGPEDTVDLDPLHALLGLQKLYLAGGFTPFQQGRYGCTRLPEHLTSLCLYATELFVGTDRTCDTVLKKLGLYDSRLIVEHDNTLFAYTALEEVHLHESNVYTHDVDLEFDDRPEFTKFVYDSPFDFWSNNDFFALKLLRVLDIKAKGDIGQVAKLALYGLASLQELGLHCTGMHLSTGEALAELTGLTKLKLIAGEGEYSHHVRIHLDVSWQAMTALQELEICGSPSSIRDLSELLNLQSLRRLKLDLRFYPEDEGADAAMVSSFVDTFLDCCPHVALRVKGLPAHA